MVRIQGNVLEFLRWTIWEERRLRAEIAAEFSRLTGNCNHPELNEFSKFGISLKIKDHINENFREFGLPHPITGGTVHSYIKACLDTNW